MSPESSGGRRSISPTSMAHAIRTLSLGSNRCLWRSWVPPDSLHHSWFPKLNPQTSVQFPRSANSHDQRLWCLTVSESGKNMFWKDHLYIKVQETAHSKLKRTSLVIMMSLNYEKNNTNFYAYFLFLSDFFPLLSAFQAEHITRVFLGLSPIASYLKCCHCLVPNSS